MREKKPERRAGVNREIHKWAFGDIDDYGNVSVLEMNDDDKPGELPSFIKKNQEENKNEEENEKEKKDRPKSGLIKKGKENSMSRSVPGNLQKNVTAERKFLKELLKLSQQRYIELINIDYQKKMFITRQANKGIYVNDGR